MLLVSTLKHSIKLWHTKSVPGRPSGVVWLTEGTVKAVSGDTGTNDQHDAGRPEPASSPYGPGPALSQVDGDKHGHGNVCRGGISHDDVSEFAAVYGWPRQ